MRKAEVSTNLAAIQGFKSKGAFFSNRDQNNVYLHEK